MVFLIKKTGVRIGMGILALCLIAVACSTPPPLDDAACPHETSCLGAPLRADISASDVTMTAAA